MTENKRKIFEKITDVLFSCETKEHFQTYKGWIERLRCSGTFDTNDMILISTLNEKKLEADIKILSAKKTIIEELERGAMFVESLTTLEKREVIRGFGDFILRFFNNRNEQKHYCVHNLPLGINLLDFTFEDYVPTLKIYLQRPGLLIGKAGETIDSLTEGLREFSKQPNLQISIVETFGYKDYDW